MLCDAMTILLADDDAASRLLIQISLQRAGFDVIAVKDGPLAFERLSRPDAPRLAVLDWVMPGLNGPDVCHMVRGLPNHPYVYIILLTANASKADVITGFAAGADDYLTKPCHAEELKARIRAGQRILDLQDQLSHDARHDALTGLPNRAQFLERLEQRANHPGTRSDRAFAVLFIDLNGFKAVNDGLGHAAGDQLLIEVSKRLSHAVRRPDRVTKISDSGRGARRQSERTLARLGGDEFTILLDDIPDPTDAAQVAVRIRKELALPFHIAGREVQIGASIGISFGRSGFGESENLLKEADAAMYRSKRSGKIEICSDRSPRSRVVLQPGSPAPDRPGSRLS